MARKKASKTDFASMSLEESISHFNSKYGANTIIIASAAKGIKIRHIPTGAYALDFALGGGWPENRIIEVRGPFSSFKSTVSLKGIANFQKKYPDGLATYVDAEKTFDAIYAQRLGCDLERILLVNPDSGEQAVDAINDLLGLAYPQFMVIDSLAALVPAGEIESTMDQQHMGLQARLINRAMRVATARLKRSMYDTSAPTTTVLALNQLRQKIGVMFGNPETTPGGMGKDFYFSVIVRLAASVAKDNIISVEEERNKVKRRVRYGQSVDFKILKNKCGGPQHEEGDFTWYEKPLNHHKKYSFDNVDALFHFGAFNDVITYDPKNGGFSFLGIKASSENRFISKLVDASPSVRRKLYHAILEKVMPANSAEAVKSKVRLIRSSDEG